MPIKTVSKPETRSRTRLGPRWNVILLDDDDHTYAYVIEMLGKIFGYGEAKAYRLTLEVDKTGRAIVWTGAKEVAELKQEQIHAYGADPRMACSAGSMTAVLELLSSE